MYAQAVTDTCIIYVN